MIDITNGGAYVEDYSILFNADESTHDTHASVLKRSLDTTSEEGYDCVVICTRDGSEEIKIRCAEDAEALMEALQMALDQNYWEEE